MTRRRLVHGSYMGRSLVKVALVRVCACHVHARRAQGYRQTREMQDNARRKILLAISYSTWQGRVIIVDYSTWQQCSQAEAKPATSAEIIR